MRNMIKKTILSGLSIGAGIMLGNYVYEALQEDEKIADRIKETKENIKNKTLEIFQEERIDETVQQLEESLANASELAKTKLEELKNTSYEKQMTELEQERLRLLNEGTFEELKQIPRVGDLIANRIIRERPYPSIEEAKKIKYLPYHVFDIE